MLQLLSGNPRTVDALGFLLAFALTALMDSVFHDKLPHDHGRAFAVNGELSKGKARGSGLIFVLCIALITLAVVPFKTGAVDVEKVKRRHALKHQGSGKKLSVRKAESTDT